MIYHSLVEKKSYKVLSVHAEKITIARASGGDDQELNKKKTLATIKKFNASVGKIKRRTLISPTVAEETALVLFHPNLAWDAEGSFIMEDGGSCRCFYLFFLK